MRLSIDTLARDLRFAVRMASKQPFFSLTVLSLLTIGIGGTTAIFSAFNGLYLRPLPFPEPERLVNLDETSPQWNLERTGIAFPDFQAWRERNQAFVAMTAFQDMNAQLSDESRAETLRAARITHDLPRVLQIKPALGRWFLPEEDQPGARRVAVLSYPLWQTRFGGQNGAIGQTIRINAVPHTIVGVMPAGVDFPNRTELWVPLALAANDGSGWGLQGVARLKPGMTMQQAREDLLRVHKGMIPARPVNSITSPTVYTLRAWYVGTLQQATTILLGAVALVLLIACVNIAGIMLARGSARLREIGIRAALGAPRSRILRQLLTENVLLGGLGGILGTVLGFQCLRALLALMPRNQIPGWVRFDLDWRFLIFCLAVTVGSAALFGLWPAWNASRQDVHAGLQLAGPRTSDSAGRRRSLQVLITAEVALAALLLTAASLLVQAFRKVERIDPGFRADHILTFQLNLPGAKYRDASQRSALLDELQTRYRRLAGVRSVALATATPLGGHWGNFFEVENAPPRGAKDADPVILQRMVSAGYLEAMGMTLRAGRTFSDTDDHRNYPTVAIVNETFARLFWQGQDPIGKRLRHRGGTRGWFEVVGVLADVKDYGLDQPSRPSVYLPFSRIPVPSAVVVLRTWVDPSALTNPAREILRSMDPDIGMARVTTMAQRLSDSMWLRRTYSWLIAIFAAVALVLVVSGLYGVISYTVSRRRREIAIRIALGAGQGRILGSVVREALAMAALGLAIGVGGGWWSSRLFVSLLFGVKATDPATYISAAAIVVLVALAASLLPAIRAARTNPTAALRIE